ncbi:MAG: porin family protein [Chitinophagales bacterium]|nr:porin family protein [Chitinophagales bacterium]
MKKICTVLFFSFACTALWAQQGFHIGYKIAPQSTWMFNGDNSDNAKYRFVSTWGVAHGPSLAYYFKPTVGVGFDLIFSKQGQKFQVQKDSDFTNHLTLRYLKLPILLHFSTDPEQPVMFTGQFGPQFAFLTKGELEVEQTIPGTILIPGTYDEVKVGYKPVNIGCVLGFGIGTSFGTDFLAMTVQLRFDFGFTDAEDKPSDDELLSTIGSDQEGYHYYYSSAPNYSDRPTTFNTTAGIEIGFKYILRTDK